MDTFDIQEPEVTSDEAAPDQKTILVTLVGIKNLKSSHTYRLEFDIAEIDSYKVKELIEKIDDAFYMCLIPNENN